MLGAGEKASCPRNGLARYAVRASPFSRFPRFCAPKEAPEKRLYIGGESSRGDGMAAPELTVAGLWGRHLAAERRRLAPATLKHRNRCVRALLDWCPVDDPRKITPAMAARYAAHRIEGALSPLTVASEMAALHAIFGWAVRKRLAKRNPFEGVRRSPARERKPPRVLSDDETARLLLAARGTVFHDVIYMFIRTGVSTQELAALRWEDVDFERRLVRIGGRPCEGEAQGKLVPRSIPMDERLAAVLARRPGGGSDAPEETGPEEDEGREEPEEEEHEEDEDVCRTTLEILDRFGETLEEARYRIDPRIARVRKGFRELARRQRMLDEGGALPGGPDGWERERKLRVMSWLPRSPLAPPATPARQEPRPPGCSPRTRLTFSRRCSAGRGGTTPRSAWPDVRRGPASAP